KTGHAEVVRVVYQPEHISFEELLKVFWENHDPTQGMRQGNDHGTQYRSAIYPTSAKQMEAALSSKENYQKVPKHVQWRKRTQTGLQMEGR
ncbi:MSRA isoform 10, partial [Pan troglodytes]